jgi:O-antigen ligase
VSRPDLRDSVVIDVDLPATPRQRPSRGYLPVALLAAGLLFVAANEGGRAPVPWHIGMAWTAIIAIGSWLIFRVAAGVPRLPRLLAWLAALAPATALLQLVPVPTGLLSVVAPGRAELVNGLADVMTAPRAVPLSIDPASTVSSLFNIVVCTLVFLLVRDLAWRARPSRSWAVVVPLVVIGCGEAIVGLMQGAADGQVLGTFRSRDHFAGFLEMTLPLTVAFGIWLLQRARVRYMPSTMDALLGCGLLAVAGLLLAAIVQSLSKGGFVASLFGMLITALLTVPGLVHSRRRRWLISLALVATAVVCVFLLPTANLIGRFAEVVSGRAADARWSVLTDGRRLLPAFPVLGSGFGTFGTAFMRYQTADVDLDFSFAHNDYLQLAAESGLFGFVVFVGLMLALFGMAVRAAWRDVDWHTRATGIGCAGSLAGIGLHSLFDFNMQIPANMLLLAWIAGLAASLSAHASAPARPAPRAIGWPQLAAVGAAVALLVYSPGRILGETQLHAAADDREPVSLAVAEQTAREHPGSPFVWSDLADAFERAGQPARAARSIDRAVTVAPDIPPVLLRAVDFYARRGDVRSALRHTAHLLEKTDVYDNQVFELCRARGISVSDMLTYAMPQGNRGPRSYMAFMLFADDGPGARAVWRYLQDHGLAGAEDASDYVNWLDAAEEHEAAAHTWRAWLESTGQLVAGPEWMVNGDFEQTPSGTRYDWHIEGDAGKVTTTIDDSTGHTGRRSLRLVFAGKANVDFGRVWNVAWLTPGRYRFRAYVRTADLTTDQGIGFRIAGDMEPRTIDTPPVGGTNDWTPVTATFHVARPGAVTVAVTRHPSLRFDGDIAGTAWVDSVSLERIDSAELDRVEGRQ